MTTEITETPFERETSAESARETGRGYDYWMSLSADDLRCFARGEACALSDSSVIDAASWSFVPRYPTQHLQAAFSEDVDAWWAAELLHNGDYLRSLSAAFAADPYAAGPIVVVESGPGVAIGDGWHRLAFALTSGLQSVPAVVGRIARETSVPPGPCGRDIDCDLPDEHAGPRHGSDERALQSAAREAECAHGTRLTQTCLECETSAESARETRRDDYKVCLECGRNPGEREAHEPDCSLASKGEPAAEALTADGVVSRVRAGVCRGPSLTNTEAVGE